MANQGDFFSNINFSSKFTALIGINKRNEITEINKSAEELLTRLYPSENVESFLGKNIEKFIEKIDLINQISDSVYELFLKNRLYYLIPFRKSSVEDYYDDETIIYFLIIDVYAQNTIRSELARQRETAEDFKEILEGSFDGILVTDKEGKVLFVNSSYERVAEIKRSEIQGKHMRDLINPIWMPESVAHIVAKERKPVSKRQIVKSGRHIMVTGRPIFDCNNEIKKIIINARDITEIYNLTEELQRARDNEKQYMSRISSAIEGTDDSDETVLAMSEQMRKVISLAEKVSSFNTTVLILGESGVGKEEIAKYIHNHSMRKTKPFVVVNCGAIPGNLLESELFGYEKGAFTGAIPGGKVGLIEAAEGGTVFLDEIGEMPLDFQAKLLRFLESKEIRRVGAIDSKNVDVRVLAATNCDLSDMVEAGTFREDLYYRLNVVQIEIPPLRKRTDAILPLASLFLNRYNKKYNQEKVLTYDVIKEMERFPWPGNVRQLKNIVENMVIVSNNEYLQPEDLPWNGTGKKNTAVKLIDSLSENEELGLNEAVEALECQILTKAKETYGTTRRIAEKLKVNQSTVVRKMQKYGLE